MMTLTNDQVLRLRTHNQRLDPRPGDPPASALEVVASVCGLQAQDLPAARLSLHTRSPGLTFAEVEHARLVERSIVRTWGLRGTLHFLAAADLGWLLPLLGPPAMAADGSRLIQLGLDEAVRRRGVEVIAEALSAAGALTRAELRLVLGRAGLPDEGQAPVHLIRLAALQGLVCLGAGEGSAQTYVLLEEWAASDPTLTGQAALADLARRSLRAYAPAGERDLASWSGIGLRQARQALELIAAELVQVEVAGAPAWLFPGQLQRLQAAPQRETSTHRPRLRLLPAFDTYLLGYASRDVFLPPQYARQVNKGGGWILPTMLLDGQEIGRASCRERV